MVVKKVRGYNRCRQDAQRLDDHQLVATIRQLRDNRKQMSAKELACFEALEDEALNRVIEQY